MYWRRFWEPTGKVPAVAKLGGLAEDDVMFKHSKFLLNFNFLMFYHSIRRKVICKQICKWMFHFHAISKQKKVVYIRTSLICLGAGWGRGIVFLDTGSELAVRGVKWSPEEWVTCLHLDELRELPLEKELDGERIHSLIAESVFGPFGSP